MGNIETKTKFSRLKVISSIGDNYLEAATRGFISQYLQENNCVGASL